MPKPGPPLNPVSSSFIIRQTPNCHWTIYQQLSSRTTTYYSALSSMDSPQANRKLAAFHRGLGKDGRSRFDFGKVITFTFFTCLSFSFIFFIFAMTLGGLLAFSSLKNPQTTLVLSRMALLVTFTLLFVLAWDKTARVWVLASDIQAKELEILAHEERFSENMLLLESQGEEDRNKFMRILNPFSGGGGAWTGRKWEKHECQQRLDNRQYKG